MCSRSVKKAAASRTLKFLRLPLLRLPPGRNQEAETVGEYILTLPSCDSAKITQFLAHMYQNNRSIQHKYVLTVPTYMFYDALRGNFRRRNNGFV